MNAKTEKPEEVWKSNTKQYRDSYDEADIIALTSDARFLVAVDAYGANCCTIAQLLGLAFDGPPYLPRGLGWKAYVNLVLEIVLRIHSGDIYIDDAARQKYSDFYRVQRPDPEDPR